LTDTTPPLSAPTAFQPADGTGYQRVLLKLSGEAFAGGQDFGIDQTVVDLIAREVVEVRKALDTQIAIVVGGGNIWRGQTAAAAPALKRRSPPGRSARPWRRRAGR